jgi:hypothetical protein
VTIAVHKSVISSLKTWVLALGSSWVWGRPAGGGEIAMTLGDGLGLGLGVAVGDGVAAPGERGGRGPGDWAVAQPAATAAAMARPIALDASARRPAIEPVAGIRAS